MKTRHAIFLDRDGVINRNRTEYVKSWGEFEFLPGTLNALRLLAGTSYYIIVVTNQSAIARGLVKEAMVNEIHDNMKREIAAAGGRIDGIYYCPHAPEDRCLCRKPASGMLFSAAANFNIDLEDSVMVGDQPSDIAAGRRAGCRTILFATAPVPEILDPRPDHVASQWESVVQYVMMLDGRERNCIQPSDRPECLA